ncbi:MAG TPA: hypothetical protein VES20_13520 [Bryobacteraceae bacterium]|nr:hypothetical protein [Bryobacteraceae bacterium]
MLTRDVKVAMAWAWLIASVVLLLVALSPLVLPAAVIANVAPVCEARRAGRNCFLCGMTTAFLRMGSGDFEGALAAHRGSLALWTSFILNFALAVTYCYKRRFELCRPLR